MKYAVLAMKRMGTDGVWLGGHCYEVETSLANYCTDLYNECEELKASNQALSTSVEGLLDLNARHERTEFWQWIALTVSVALLIVALALLGREWFLK